MHDIRSDLEERANLIDEQIRAAYAHFEKTIEQLQNERDAKIADLKSTLAMVAKFMDFEQRYMSVEQQSMGVEQRYMGNVSPAVPTSPLIALADLFVRKLNEVGSMSRDDLVDLAVKEGFFPDAENAIQGVHPMLVNMLRSEQIRELSNGNFAPPTLSQAIKLRRVI
jgi:hypothetical protein